MSRPLLVIFGILFLLFFQNWGFFGHQRINRLAVFTLPPEMIGFYKSSISYITEAAVNPDRRRFSSVDEAPRHYIDLDHYGDSAIFFMPRYWDEAVNKYSEDTLKAYGIVPWHVNRMYYSLRDAFFLRDPQRILRISAEIGHYIGDAHVPLHTTENYNGQLTGQEGIHAFWESRLPEMFSNDFDFFVGRANYITNPQQEIWEAVKTSHEAVDSVLHEEKKLSQRMGSRKYSFETKGRQTVRVYSRPYSIAYYKLLDGMVERRMRASIKMIGDFWYSAWVDAGQPDLRSLIDYIPTQDELTERRLELQLMRNSRIRTREHETDNN
jgi:hypothetical protein